VGPRKLISPLPPWIIAEQHPRQNEVPTRRIMERITNMQPLGSGIVNSGNVTNSYNTITLNNKAITVNKTGDEDSQIKQWLSPLEPRHRHQSVQANRVDGVGGWLLERTEFREWSSSQGIPKHAVLFCYGDPGVGKTHIRSVRKLSPASRYH